jgi:YHYH protein
MRRLLSFSLLLTAMAGAAFAVILTATTPADATKKCPTAKFPDLTGTSAGSGYVAPAVAARCTSTELIVTSNGMIGYTFEPTTPNALTAQDYTWKVPLTPRTAATTTGIVNTLGTLGFTVTGLPIYGPTEGPFPAAEAYGDPVYNKILDTCGGHTGPQSEYHNHTLNIAAACNLKKRSVVGYALDGFPIYGRAGCLNTACTKVATMKSGYVKTGDPTSNSWSAYTYKKSNKVTVLDKCNGRVEPDGTYGYHATAGFPYIIGCYRGTPTTQAGPAGAPMPPMGAPPM